MIRQPFSWLPATRRCGVLLGASLLSTVLMVAIVVTNMPLQNLTAPSGIVSLQLAGSLQAAQRIIASWDAPQRSWVLINLGIDYLYLLAYATTLGLGCQLLGGRFREGGGVARLGAWLSWGAVAAGLLDAVENGLLIGLLLGGRRESWVALSYGCAVTKFALVLAALVYLVGGSLVCLLRGTFWNRQ